MGKSFQELKAEQRHCADFPWQVRRLISQDIATNFEVWVVYKTSLLALILISIALSNWILSAFLVDCEGGRNIFFLFC